MILIDPPLWPARGRRWSHVASDSSLRELHDFAAAVRIPERAFAGDHYDVPEERYAQAVSAGAIPVSTRELLRRLRASGLRRSKRRGERVVASRRDLSGGCRVDAVVSTLAPPGPVTGVQAVILYAGDLLVLDDGEGYALPAADVRSGGGTHLDAGRALADGLVGAAWSQLPPRQVGYLRRVPDGGTRPLDVEVVLRWPDAGPAPRAVRPGDGWDRDVAPQVPSCPAPGSLASRACLIPQDPRASGPPPLRWVPVRRALALLPVDVAPVAIAEHQRSCRGHLGEGQVHPASWV